MLLPIIVTATYQASLNEPNPCSQKLPKARAIEHEHNMFTNLNNLTLFHATRKSVYLVQQNAADIAMASRRNYVMDFDGYANSYVTARPTPGLCAGLTDSSSS